MGVVALVEYGANMVHPLNSVIRMLWCLLVHVYTYVNRICCKHLFEVTVATVEAGWRSNALQDCPNQPIIMLDQRVVTRNNHP